MKSFSQKPKLVLSLEKDDKKNTTGMQMRVWFLNNNTTILVRLFQHNPDMHKKLWDGKRTNGQVEDFVLNLLGKNKVIANPNNWKTIGGYATELEKQDEFEEKDECLYFAWFIRPELLYF